MLDDPDARERYLTEAVVRALADGAENRSLTTYALRAVLARVERKERGPRWRRDSRLVEDAVLDAYIVAAASNRYRLHRQGEPPGGLQARLERDLGGDAVFPLAEECVEEAAARTDGEEARRLPVAVDDSARRWYAHVVGALDYLGVQSDALVRKVAARSRPPTLAIAEDCVGRAHAHIVERAYETPYWLVRDFASFENVVGFSYRIAARRYVRTLQQRAERQRELAEDDALPDLERRTVESVLEAAGAAEELEALVDVDGEQNARILVLRVDGFTYDEIARGIDPTGETPAFEVFVRIWRLCSRYPGLEAVLPENDPVQVELYFTQWMTEHKLLDVPLQIELVAAHFAEVPYADLVRRESFSDSLTNVLRQRISNLKEKHEWLAELTPE
jgi:DNA-directed RNA polymerase specialized sigma24 family protein